MQGGCLAGCGPPTLTSKVQWSSLPWVRIINATQGGDLEGWDVTGVHASSGSVTWDQQGCNRVGRAAVRG